MRINLLILLFFLTGAAVFFGGCNDNSTENVPPKVTLSLAGSPMDEAEGSATLTATLSAASRLPVTVDLAFSGTAMMTDDYTRSGLSILIPAGETQGIIALQAVPDTSDENDETIIVDIDAVTNGEESDVQQVTASIIDDDLPPVTVKISGTVATGAPLSTAVVSAVNVLGDSAGPVNVNTDGTYALSINEGAPYMLKAYSEQGGITLFSYSDGSEIANITPLTELALFVAAGLDSGLEDLFSTWKNNPIPESEVMTASRLVNATLTGVYRTHHVDAGTYNFFETPITMFGHGIDGVLDDLKITIDPDAPTMDTLIRIVSAGENIIPFDPYADISNYFLIDRITPAAVMERLIEKDVLLVCSYGDEACGAILIKNTLLKSELEQRMTTLPKTQEIIFY